MVTVILVLIAVLAILKLVSMVRDRQMDDPKGVSLRSPTWEDSLPRAAPHHPWAASGTLWSDGSGGDYFDDGGSDAGGGDFDGGDSGGGGDFGGGDSG